jgi:hypothetical protein
MPDHLGRTAAERPALAALLALMVETCDKETAMYAAENLAQMQSDTELTVPKDFK